MLMFGDFNAHHELLGFRYAKNEIGRHIAILLKEMDGITLLNRGDPPTCGETHLT